jgi:hypothetical protein
LESFCSFEPVLGVRERSLASFDAFKGVATALLFEMWEKEGDIIVTLIANRIYY